MHDNQILLTIRENWTILVFLGSLIWSYANLKGHVGQLHSEIQVHKVDSKEKWIENDKQHEKFEKEINSFQPVIMEIRERLVKIETILASLVKHK